ncbi:tetratricopeptide repeat protein [Geotalea toluenoxydans]|uniref:tetratricopeptide repeat protein n=1 Tax=Geotalea toluenoxydans TaxID=421624 RepID=UPI001FB1D73B|nr:tetratricopeptide repeat protein [Geotalea toluenoxydans]
MYDQGDGIKQDWKEAVKWYRKSADQGFDQAQFSLGLMYFHGHGVKQNRREAIRWFVKAAKNGSEEAIRTLEALGRHVPLQAH